MSLNLYAGTPESGNADYFMYKNVLYTLVKSGTTYVAVQKSYTVYAAHPVTNQQQLAVFDLAGTIYMVTDGTTAGAATKAGINAGTMWAQTATTTSESQFGLVYGFIAQPTNVTQSVKGVFQFQVTDSLGNITLYDIIYASGGNTNMVTVDVPNLLPDFTQSPTFGFVPSCPLMFETGGYNAFTTSVAETTLPSESFAGSYRTPVVSTDSGVDNLISAQGDFSLEFWHSLPLTGPRIITRLPIRRAVRHRSCIISTSISQTHRRSSSASTAPCCARPLRNRYHRRGGGTSLSPISSPT